ncbi:MAG: hypothetical protein M1840_009134 [Geoglossum simile]|nr:MAG: hypothetical protein M1840_009134 [Geoglossum simile]
MSLDDNDPAHWVFPPSGASNVPVEVSSSFGPVRYSDSMILQWVPATQQMLVGFCYIPPGNTASCTLLDEKVMSPYTWKFLQRPPYNSTICHLYFHNTTLGNTVTWEYLTEAAADPITWAAQPASTPTPTSTSSVSIKDSSITTSQSPAAPTSVGSASLSTSTPLPGATQPSGSKHSSLLSAGIGVLATVSVLAIALSVWLWLRRRRPAKLMEGSTESPQDQASEPTPQRPPPVELSSPVTELPSVHRKPLELL